MQQEEKLTQEEILTTFKRKKMKNRFFEEETQLNTKIGTITDRLTP